MLSLIDKVNNIVAADKATAGTSIELLNYPIAGSFSATSSNPLKFIPNVNGSIKIKISQVSSSSGGISYLYIDLLREGSTISNESFKLNSYGSYIDIEYDLTNVKLNDIVNIYTKGAFLGENGKIVISYDRL